MTNFICTLITSPEQEADLIDDLMEKESLIEKSDTLSDIEKAVIEVELEKKLTHEILESKEKDQFMSQATEDPNHSSGSTTEKSPELTTTDSINPGSSTEKKSSKKMSKNLSKDSRNKRDIHSTGKTTGETIVEEAMEMSEATLDDPNASSRETERAEQLFVYTKDFIENLEAIDKSNISDKEKIEIEDKIEGDAIAEAAEASQDLAEFTKPLDSKEAREKQVKENLETFLEDVDIQR